MEKIAYAAENRAQRNKRMVSEMSNAKTLMWVAVALVIHAVIILGTSKEYIRVHWLGGKPADVAAGDDAPAAPVTAAAPPATPAVASVPAKPAAAQANSGMSDDEKKLAERANSPMVKSITDTAKPSELPKVNPLELNDKP
jgi:hypothetical protein